MGHLLSWENSHYIGKTLYDITRSDIFRNKVNTLGFQNKNEHPNNHNLSWHKKCNNVSLNFLFLEACRLPLLVIWHNKPEERLLHLQRNLCYFKPLLKETRSLFIIRALICRWLWIFLKRLLDQLHLKTEADDHRADRKYCTIAETLMRMRRGVAWRREAELFSLTSTGKWSLTSSAWQTEATERRVKKKTLRVFLNRE